MRGLGVNVAMCYPIFLYLNHWREKMTITKAILIFIFLFIIKAEYLADIPQHQWGILSILLFIFSILIDDRNEKKHN
jgi:hypothetical protein